MKRFILIAIVSLSVGWIGYAAYELWINKANKLTPEYVFCKEDHAILLINNLEETQLTNYLDLVKKNPMARQLHLLDSLPLKGLKYYVSEKRPILLVQKPESWNSKTIKEMRPYFKHQKMRHNGHYLFIYNSFTPCSAVTPVKFFLEGDKKASANYWIYDEKQWKRTDVYNLHKGFFKYQTSSSIANYGKPVRDIPLFSTVIPYTITHYLFKERFYAAQHDSVIKNGPIHQWINTGLVEMEYNHNPVIVTDYRSQQLPQLILKEKVNNDTDFEQLKDMVMFKGFQLTKNFPRKKGMPFYVFEIENKAFFTTSKDVARKLMVEYQLGNTLALHPEQEKQFFEGLPSHVNLRDISRNKKMSVTWKNKLRFEVSSRPPKEQLQNRNKLTWSAPIDYNHPHLVTIYDHLREGISAFVYDNKGKYRLIGPNGGEIWHGDLHTPIEGQVNVIDVFDNNKHQFLFHTKNKVYLIDLNGNSVGGFPYESSSPLTSGISTFTWEGAKRFLIGDEKGEVSMISNAGKGLKTVTISNNPITKTPFALNIDGKLRVWAEDDKKNTYMGYLIQNKKAETKEKIQSDYTVKSDGKLLHYSNEKGAVYFTIFDSKNNKSYPKEKLVNGKIIRCTSHFIIIANKENYSVFDHQHQLLFRRKFPFKEIENFNFLPQKKMALAMDAVKNKIHAYTASGIELAHFPKEGRNKLVAQYNKYDKTVYVFTTIGQSIICYKAKIND